MAHGPTRFPSKGYCIYCRAVGIPLTNEHIVPLSLGGQHILEGASCASCADVTKRFEQDVARELWGHGRISADAPSRRKKKRPTHINVGHPAQVTVPYREYPPQFPFYKMSLPGIFQGRSPDEDISPHWQIIVLCDDTKLNEFAARHKTQITLSFRHVPESFGRAIAKIGYGHILTQLDLDDFEPTILPYILGTESNVSYVVGSAEDIEQPQQGIGYRLGTQISGQIGSAFVVAEVRLLANCHSPTYLVVVGRTTTVEQTRCVIEKLGPGELTVIPPP